MKKTTKRLLAAVLCLVMVLGALPLTALADTQTADVVYGKDEGSGWSYDGTVSDTVTVGDNITLKKTAKKTADNQYEVTLEVQLKQTSKTTSAAAATVLVMDTSGSMAYCSECGKEVCICAYAYPENYKEANSTNTNRRYYYIKNEDDTFSRVYRCNGVHGRVKCDGGEGWYTSQARADHTAANKLEPKASASDSNSNHVQFYYYDEVKEADTKSRLEAAKEAAIAFLQTYSGLKDFGTNGKTTDETDLRLGRYVSVVNFADASVVEYEWCDVSNPVNFNNVLDDIDELKADGGTNLDSGLRRADNQFNVSPISSMSLSADHKNVVALTDGTPTYYLKVRNECNDFHIFSTETIGSTQYCRHGDGSSTSENEYEATETAATDLKKTAKLFTVCFENDETLKTFLSTRVATDSHHAFAANNRADLLEAFSSIAETVTTGLNAGTVTDNLPTAGVTTTSTDFVDGVMSWELDPADDATDRSTYGDTTTYTYTKTYTVTIDPDEVAPDAYGYVPLNGETTFTYTDATGEHKEYFPIPAGKVTPNVKYTLIYKDNVNTDNSHTDSDLTDTTVTLKNVGTGTNKVNFTTPTAETGHTNVVFIGWTTDITVNSILDKGDTVPTLVTSVAFSEDETEKTVYAVWGYDDIGGEDSGNGTPDVFDGTVTFKVVNGAWSSTTSDTERTVTKPLYEKNSNNEWVENTGVVLETSDIPSVDSVVAFSDYKKPGTWDAKPEVGYAFVDDTTYTYTLPELGSYTVTYVPNAGSDTVSNMPSSQTKTEGMPLTLGAGIPSRTNYAFQGWNTQADGGGTTYASGDSYETDANLTLYAQWQENEKYTYTLKYNANGGTSAPVDDVYPADDGKTYDESHTFDVSTAEPTRANYTFLGWADNASATTAQYTSAAPNNTVTVSNTDEDCTKTIYAVWLENDKNVYTLTYNANAGSETVDNVPTDGSAQTHETSYTFTVDTATTPAREGYEFLGWADSADAATAQYTSTNNTVTVTEESPSKVVYAVWKQKQANLSVAKTVYSIKRGESYIYGSDTTAGTGTIPYVQTDDVIVWQITVTNSGNVAGTADLTDTLTKAEGETEKLTTFYTDAGCATEASSENDDYTVAANGSKTYYVKYQVAAADAGKTLKNAVTVNNTPQDGTTPDVPVGQAELSVRKYVHSINGVGDTNQGYHTGGNAYSSVPTVKVGDKIIWGIEVTNKGTADGKFTLTDDLLGENCVFYHVHSVTDNKCVLSAPVTSWPQTIDDCGDATGTITHYYVEYTVTEDDIGTTLVNTVTLKEAGKADKDSTAPGVPVGGLTVEKDVTGVGGKFEAEIEYPVNPANERAAAAAPTTAKVGETITWTITVKNYYSSEQTFTLEDTLSNGKQVTLNPAPSSDGEYTIAAAKSVGEPTVKTITATYVVQASDEGKTLVNTAIIKQDGEKIDDGTAPGVEVEGKLDVSKYVYSITRNGEEIYKISDNTDVPEAKIGDKITWGITVSNTGKNAIRYTLADALKGETEPLTIYAENHEDEIGANEIQTIEAPAEGYVVSYVFYYVDYTVKTSDYGETLINVATVTEKNEDGGDSETHPAESNPVKVEDKPNTPSYNPNYNAGVQLEKGEHFNYVIGYSDGTVRPEGNITRAEVATIFFRLLTDESRKTYLTEYNTFTDVEKSMWHNVAISTLARAGVLNGYNDGSFRPDNNITRAEMAAIISRFAELEGSTRISFTDIKGHWAEKSILLAASNGWINGYNDGSFRPDQNITRAETFAMINRVLERKVEHVNDLVSDMNTWVDNMDTTQWYYFDVQEATNYHSYQRKYTNTNAEKWIKKLTDIDWTVYQY